MKKSNFVTSILLLSLVFITGLGKAQTSTSIKTTYDKLEYAVPMRDGVKLYTSIYIPKQPGKHPILLERTPYGAGPYGVEAYRAKFRGSKKMVEAGYIFAYQDVRGLGRSEGVFVNDRPLIINKLKPDDIDESTDTYDAIEYLVKNVPNNNSRVGLWGISYPGFYAAIGAVNSHPALKAASPQAPVSDWFIGDDFHHNGALFLMDAIGFAKFGQSKEAAALSNKSIDTAGDPFQFYLKHGSLSELTNTYFKETDGLWKFVMEHGTYDEYWQSRSLPNRITGVHCAVMTVGGWFDAEDCWGALHTYKGTEALNSGIRNSLVMGPWYHGMWASPDGTKFGDQDFGMNTSAYFQDEIEFPFFDSNLRGDGRMKRPEAQVFQTGSNRWRSFAHWPPTEAKQTKLTLHSGNKATFTGVSENEGDSFDQYLSDPATPVPYQGGTIKGRTREYMIDDQRFASKRSDVLSYRSEVLTKTVNVAGPVVADIELESDSTDADLVVKVIDVFPNDAPGKLAGYEMLLRAEVMRTKFRKSWSNPSPLASGQIEEVKYDMPDICHAFLPGHRIMIQIQSSWFPLVDRNPQQYMDIYKAKSEDFKPATIKIHRSKLHPSSILFNIIPN